MKNCVVHYCVVWLRKLGLSIDYRVLSKHREQTVINDSTEKKVDARDYKIMCTSYLVRNSCVHYVNYSGVQVTSALTAL